MELTAEQFELITGLTSQPPIYDGVDKRRHPRVAFGSRARIFPMVPIICPEGRSVLVRDISVAGIGLLFSDPLAIGDEIILQLPAQRGEPLVVHCMVQRCDIGGSHGKQFVIGATYEQVLDPSVLTDDSMKESPLLQSAMANLSSIWRTPAADEAAAPAGPISRIVTGVWNRLKGKAQATPDNITEQLTAPPLTAVVDTPIVCEPLPVTRRSNLFAVSEAPATGTLVAPAEELQAIDPVDAAPVEPVAIEPSVDVAASPVAVVEPAEAVALAPEAVKRQVQDVMWMPETVSPRTTVRPRATIHRIGSRHSRRMFKR